MSNRIQADQGGERERARMEFVEVCRRIWGDPGEPAGRDKDQRKGERKENEDGGR